MTHTQLKIRLLGRLEWRYGNGAQPEQEPPRPATTKSQSLLAYLVFNQGKQHARERLMAMFWGDRSERKARRSLSTALWHIRRCMPDENYILSDGQVVEFAFPGEVWLDTEQFEVLAGQRDISSMQTAVELYRGDLMDGFYDDWIINERYRLENLYIDVLAQLVDAYEMAGNHAAALETAQRLLQIDSLREDAYRAAMRALCRLGRRHDALAQYERCQQVIREELNTEPMAETTTLHRDIVEGRFEVVAQPLILQPPPQVLTQPGSGRNPLDAASAIPLVGRERELALLAERWQTGRAGGCSLVLISGEAGVGKTRLVQETITPLQWQGVCILQGRCYEFEGVLPYQPVAEALRSMPPALVAGVSAELPGWVNTQVARLAPDLFAVTPKNAEREAGGEQPQLFEGVVRFLAGLATREPLLLVFEDLHWATDSTLQLLHYLARHLTAQPLLIVGTLRPETVSPAHTLATLGRRLEREGMAQRIRLRPLSAAAVETLIAQLAGDGESVKPLARRLFRETEGNPFYLIETIKTLFEQDAIRLEAGVWQADIAALSQANLPLPASVEETILARVERLEEDTQDAVHLAAVVGKEFDLDLLDAAWGQDGDATLAAVDDLLRKRLIGEGVGEAKADYFFTHHKIQEVVYQNLQRHRRQYLHGQVGTALEHLVGEEVETRAGELAFHFEQACLLNEKLTKKAVVYLRQAGEAASNSYAHREAIDFYQRALRILDALSTSEPDQLFRRQAMRQLNEKLADTYRLMGEMPQAQDAFGIALQNTTEDERIIRARLHYKVATMINWSEQERTHQVLDAGEVALGDQPTEPKNEWWDIWLSLQMRRAMAFYWEGDPQAMETQVNKIKPHIEVNGTPEQQSFFYGLLGNHGFVLDRYIPSPQTLQYCRTSYSAAQNTGDPDIVADAEFRLGFALLWLDRLDEAETLLRKSQAYADKAGIANSQLLCQTYLTYLYRKRQQLEQTAQLATKCLELAHKVGALHYVAAAHGALAWVAQRQGDPGNAEKHGQKALGICRTADTAKNSPLRWTMVWPLLGVASMTRDIPKAIEYTRMMLDPSQQQLPEEMANALESAVAAWESGQSNLAQRYIEEAAEIAIEKGFL